MVGQASSSKDIRESRCTCQPTLPHLLSPGVHDRAHVQPLTHCPHLPNTTCSSPTPPHLPFYTCRPASVHDCAQVFRNRPQNTTISLSPAPPHLPHTSSHSTPVVPLVYMIVHRSSATGLTVGWHGFSLPSCSISSKDRTEIPWSLRLCCMCRARQWGSEAMAASPQRIKRRFPNP